MTEKNEKQGDSRWRTIVEIYNSLNQRERGCGCELEFVPIDWVVKLSENLGTTAEGAVYARDFKGIAHSGDTYRKSLYAIVLTAISALESYDREIEVEKSKAEKSKAEKSKAEKSKVEKSKVEKSKAEKSKADIG